jgi:hypothetical protein
MTFKKKWNKIAGVSDAPVKYLLDKVCVVSYEDKYNTILQLGADISDTLEKEYDLSIPSDNEDVVF